ncbi:helix-turn-helix domain-containing protein [uncultured Corynebacterium sp.]|uniref:helix-turn-helix transcriptional regulator n=1 Tax=uncultured Corynebacterium sp. TaxID=159447 RepID=UPI00262E2448|nr:helix-turn-helix domain-containing protein [uncultured Corynebacterium sp.]
MTAPITLEDIRHVVREELGRAHQTDQSQPMSLNEKDAAKFIGVPHSTLQRWRRDGVGPKHYRLGRPIFYTIAALEEWMENEVN